jgi:hypothetical protein
MGTDQQLQALTQLWKPKGGHVGLATYECLGVVSRGNRSVGQGSSTSSTAHGVTGNRVANAKPVALIQRAREHPDQMLLLKMNQLWCNACSCRVSLGKQATSVHVASRAHVQKCIDLQEKLLQEQSRVEEERQIRQRDAECVVCSP